MGRSTEKAGREAAETMVMRLYVAGKSPNSVRAMANLNAICQEHLAAGSYRLETVDVFTDPLRALKDGVLMTPTLVKASPVPVHIVGDLSDRAKVLHALGLPERTS